MTSWTALVLALPEPEAGAMVSRLPGFLHPVAGRPLIWHTVAALAGQEVPPSRVLVLSPLDLTGGIFEGLPAEVAVLGTDLETDGDLPGLADPVLVSDAATYLGATSLRPLLEANAEGAWLAGADSSAVVARLPAAALAEIAAHPSPLQPGGPFLARQSRADAAAEALVVRTRSQLAQVHRCIRDQLVRSLMEGGITFLLPDSVVVDVDVRIGRDTVVFPGVVLEGQTTIGEETVVGPGCRIIDSWIGSGVELKGWNYISHTSVRNRAILEPYVRRGFD